MASILEFRKSLFPRRPLPADATRGSADIVLFPGVRYERMGEEPSPAPKPRARRGRRRDRLDLDG